MPKEVRAYAPATVANVACGFDIFGFALERPGDEVVVRLTEAPGVSISAITGDKGVLPLDPAKNTAGVAAMKMLEHLNIQQGVEIEVHKKMPLGSGLGSSAASAAGCLAALNHLLGGRLSTKELIPFAMEGERVACGAAHADNVAPALMGGFVLIRSYSPLDIIKIPSQVALYCTILHPHMEVRTEDSRKLLGNEVSLHKHVQQSGNAAGLVVGLMLGDVALIRNSLQDVIAEPKRSPLIPGFDEIKAAGLAAGALGVSISGSGPSIFALSLTQKDAEIIAEAMFRRCSVRSSLYISKINDQGPVILS